MTPRPPTDVDALRAALLDHAQAVIARDGVDGLTMRALAAEAGMAVGMSYKAFASREELLRELTRRSVEDLAAQVEQWALRPGGRLADRLLELADLQRSSQAPALIAQLSHRAAGQEILREAVATGTTRSWATVLAEFLQARQRAGEITTGVDLEAYAFMITAALHYLLVNDGPFPVPDRSTLARCLAGVAAQLEIR